MAPIIIREKGMTEIIIDNGCEFSKFYRGIEILKNDFGMVFSSEIDGIDSLYWDFEYKKSELTIHYNIYTGISVYAKAFENATLVDNENVIKIGQLLFEKVNEKE